MKPKHDITIEKGVEQPDFSKNGAGRPPVWGKWFMRLENVGDSFFVPEGTTAKMGRTAFYWNQKLKPAHFSVRSKNAKGEQEQRDGVAGVRVWRRA